MKTSTEKCSENKVLWKEEENSIAKVHDERYL